MTGKQKIYPAEIAGKRIPGIVRDSDEKDRCRVKIIGHGRKQMFIQKEGTGSVYSVQRKNAQLWLLHYKVYFRHYAIKNNKRSLEFMHKTGYNGGE